LLKLINTLTVLTSVFFSAAAYAEFKDFTWGGFLTQGLVHTDGNNFAGESENSISTDFREAGIYGLWRPTSHLRLGAQIVARKLGNLTDDAPQFDYLSADYSFLNSYDSDFGVRIGKLKVPYGFYNDVREIPFARTSILLPQAMYFDQARDFQISALGGSLYGFKSFEDYRVEQELLLAQPRKDEVAEYALLNDDFSGKFERSRAVIYRGSLNDVKDRWRLGLTLGDLSLDYAPGANRELGLKNGTINVQFFVLGAQYNLEKISFTSEYTRHFIDHTDLGGVFLLFGRQTYEAFYLESNYRLANKWNVFLRYDVVYRDVNDRDGKKKEAIFGIPAATQWSKDITLGLGWQATQSILLRAEWHHIRGTARAPEQDNRDSERADGHWNMFLMQAAYRF